MTPLVFVPGMMCDARLFTPQIAAFSHERAIHIASIGACDTIDGLAADLLMKAPPRFALAGLSMGGIVAMEVLRQMPERVERIALLDTNPLAERQEVKDAREPQIIAAREGRLLQVMRDEMTPRYVVDGPQKRRILHLCIQMALDTGADIFIRQSRALQARPDQSETLRRAKIPALVLCGANDVLCPPERHRLMHDMIAGFHLEIIPQAGHLPTLEQPDITNEALRRWMETP